MARETPFSYFITTIPKSFAVTPSKLVEQLRGIISVEQTFNDVAFSKLVCLCYEVIKGAFGNALVERCVNSLEESFVALGNADNVAFCIVGNLADHNDFGIVLLIAFGNSGLNISAVQLAANDLSDDVGNLGEAYEVGVSGIFLSKTFLNGADLSADLIAG